MWLERFGWFLAFAVGAFGSTGFAAFCMEIPAWAAALCWLVVIAAAAWEGQRRGEDARVARIAERWRSGFQEGLWAEIGGTVVGFWSWGWSGLPGSAGGPVALCALAVFEGLSALLRAHARRAQGEG